MKLLYFEIRKLFAGGRLPVFWALCATLGVVFCLFSKPTFLQYDFDVGIFRKYVEQFGDKYSEQTVAVMEQELQSLNATLALPYDGPPGDPAAEQQYRDRQYLTTARLTALSEVFTRYPERGSERELVYDLEFTQYESEFLRVLMTVLCCCSLVAVAVPLALSDLRCNMEPLLFTASYGRLRVARSKGLLGFFLGAFVTALFAAEDILLAMPHYNFGNMTASLFSYAGHFGYAADMSLRHVIGLSVLTRILAGGMFTLLLMIVLRLFRNDIAGLSVFTVFIVASELLARSTPRLCAWSLWRQLQGTAWFTFSMPVWIVLLLQCTLITTVFLLLPFSERIKSIFRKKPAG